MLRDTLYPCEAHGVRPACEQDRVNSKARLNTRVGPVVWSRTQITKKGSRACSHDGCGKGKLARTHTGPGSARERVEGTPRVCRRWVPWTASASCPSLVDGTVARGVRVGWGGAFQSWQHWRRRSGQLLPSPNACPSTQKRTANRRQQHQLSPACSMPCTTVFRVVLAIQLPPDQITGLLSYR